MNAAAIILAAGESRRMGRPKAFLPFRQGTFLSAIASVLGTHCSPVIAVFGFDAASGIARSQSLPLQAIANTDYELGMLTSLQIGLRALPDHIDTVLFTLVDHPAIAPGTVEVLLQSGAPIAIPKFEGKRGHPVLIRHPIIEEFLAEPAT